MPVVSMSITLTTIYFLPGRSNIRHRSLFASRQAAVLVFTQSRDGPER